MANHSDGDNKPPWTKAAIIDIKTLGPVKLLRLEVKDHNFTFKPGQWVDFNISGVTPFTGYSMVSPPSLLASSNVLDLAIKYSDYPPTLWVHEKCKLGDKVDIRVGGDFYYISPSPTSPSKINDVLLLAGGVGINPLYSILQHYLEQDDPERKITLLYSAKSPAELVFMDDILKLTNEYKSCFTATLFSTQHAILQTEMSHIKEGRIAENDIKEALSKINKASVEVFICGPPGFLDLMETFCLSQGLQKDQILYEKWW